MPVAPKGTNAGTCSTCKAPVLWCRTQKEKAMPLDPEPRADGNIELRPQPPLGNVVAVYVKTTGTLDMLAASVRYVSHFATCPDAKKHRKKPKAKRISSTPSEKNASVPHNGTDTSKAAAGSMVPHVGGLQAEILKLIAAAGRHGMTCDEIEIKTKLRHQTASARVRELVLKGRIARIGKRKTSSGRQAAVYAVEGGQ